MHPLRSVFEPIVSFVAEYFQQTVHPSHDRRKLYHGNRVIGSLVLGSEHLHLKHPQDVTKEDMDIYKHDHVRGKLAVFTDETKPNIERLLSEDNDLFNENLMHFVGSLCNHQSWGMYVSEHLGEECYILIGAETQFEPYFFHEEVLLHSGELIEVDIDALSYIESHLGLDDPAKTAPKKKL